MAALLKITCMVLIAAAVVGPAAEAAISCDVVYQKLAGCLPFATGTGPIGTCCTDITSLISLATTTADRQAICSCIKPFLSFPGVDFTKVAQLSGQCGVTIPNYIAITPSTNCTAIQ